ncbi:hypothetical protein [Pantanalinema sp. GBBB05]|uniref:hypothetical protein n=1 Tax=Pantanalinema sp. GBBB05 TaxID=2604139 RepID=UPI001DEE2ED3|nr:hypothetical protein [Pantanalinema sp. GBBB05]
MSTISVDSTTVHQAIAFIPWIATRHAVWYFTGGNESTRKGVRLVRSFDKAKLIGPNADIS